MRGIEMNVLLFFRHEFFALPKETPRINTVFNVQKHISSVKSVPKFNVITHLHKKAQGVFVVSP